MKKIGIILIFIINLYPASAFCETFLFGIVASGDVVVGNAEVQSKQAFGTIAGGIGIAYAAHEYTIGEGMVALRSDRLLPGLQYGLGFKGFFGTVEDERSDNEAALSSIGFILDVDYELTSAFNPVEVPIVAYVGMGYSPPPMSFDDTKTYQEYKGGFRFHLLESAFVSLECKYRKIDFDDDTGGNWDRDDTIITAGLTLRL